jgi:hypothetical protein
MLDDLPSALAARERVDMCPPQELDVADTSHLLDYVGHQWPDVKQMLAAIPPTAWPPGATKVENAVIGINETLRRPLPLR